MMPDQLTDKERLALIGEIVANVQGLEKQEAQRINDIALGKKISKEIQATKNKKGA